MKFLTAIWHFLTAPYRMVVGLLSTLVNLNARQMRAIFSLAMLGGIVALSAQNFFYIAWAKRAIELGTAYMPWFNLLADQIRFHSWLIGILSGIVGMVVIGADWLRAKYGQFEVGFGKGADTADKALPEDVPDENDELLLTEEDKAP